MTPHEPTATHLHCIPCLLEGKKYTMLMYTNDMAVEFVEGKKGALMIVAIPNPEQKEDFALVDPTSDEMKAFRGNIASRCELLMREYVSISRKKSGRSYGS
jgi:hypothetical protein